MELLTNISQALAQTFDASLSKQWNRLAVLASTVEARPKGGKNAAFDVEFSGATASTVAEGSDVATGEYATDVDVPAILSWAEYRSAFQISERELDAAATSMGTPNALMDLFGDRVEGSMNKLISKINNDMFNATGADSNSNPTIVGLQQGPLETTGVYAGINRTTYSEWAGNKLSNGGVARPLSFDLLYQLEQQIYTNSGEVPTMIVTTPAVFRKYAGIFEAVRRLSTDGGGPLEYSAGASRLNFAGMPVIRDRDCPAGCLFMISPRHIQALYLPRLGMPQDTVYKNMKAGEGSNGDGVRTMTGIPVQIVPLSKTGTSMKVMLNTTLQMCVRRPNACGYISDLAES